MIRLSWGPPAAPPARRTRAEGMAAWSDRVQLLKSGLAWRLLDLTAAGGKRVDLVIATRFPSYLVRHPRKVVWLVHQRSRM